MNKLNMSNLEFNFHKAQSDVIRESSKFKLLRAGRGFGKSHLIRKLAVLDILSYPHTHQLGYSKPVVSILGKHSTLLTQIHWNILVQECSTIYSPFVKKIHAIEKRIEFKNPNFPDLILRGLDKGALGDNLRGLSFYKTYVDEAQEVALIPLLDEVIKPRMETPGSSFMAIFTPKGFTNDTYRLKQRFEETGEGKEFHYTSYDNPFRDKEELDELEKTMVEKKFKQEILADYIAYDTQIFTEFSAANIKELPEKIYQTYYIALDSGSRNPAVVVAGIYRKSDGRLALDIIDYFYNTTEASVTVEEVIEQVRLFTYLYKNIYRTFVPDDRPDIQKSLMKALPDCHPIVISRAKPNPASRRDTVNRCFKNNSLSIIRFPDKDKLVFLTNEIESYSRKIYMGIILDIPAENQQDHLVDAIGYLVGEVILKNPAEFFSLT